MNAPPSLSLRGRDRSRNRGNLTIFAIILGVIFFAPTFVSAATTAGVKPGSFFYIFDTVSEKIALFFTFNPQKKAKKALEYADERLAEIEAIAEEKNPDAVKTAVADYESNVALATEKSKEVADKGQAESLLTAIEDNASKNQEVLSVVLIKVPEEAKAAIARAIEASKKGQEEAAKQIADLKGEVEKLKQEVVELKQVKDASQPSEVEKLKKEVEALKQAQRQKPVETRAVEKVADKVVEVPRVTSVQTITSAQSVIKAEEQPLETSVIPAIPTVPAMPAIPSIPATTPATPAIPATPATPPSSATTPATPSLVKVYKSPHHVIYDSFYSGPLNQAVFVIFIEASNFDLYLGNMDDIDLEIISDDFVKSDLNIRFDTATQNKSYIPAGQKWTAQLNFDAPAKSGKFQVVLNGFKAHGSSNKPIIFDGFPIKSNVISIKGPVDNLLVNVSQIPVDSLWSDYIAQFRVTYDESITLNDFSFTFNNSNPLARLYNVDLQGMTIPVISPGDTIKFSVNGGANFDVDIHELNKIFVKDFVLKGSNETGWSIEFNSITAKRKYFPSLPITLTGLPINVFPRDRSLKLELLPSTLSGLISPSSSGRYNILELKLTSEYRNPSINSAKILLVGETVNDGGNSNKVVASVIEGSTYVIKQQPFESGVSKTYTYGNPGYQYDIGYKWQTTIYVQLDITGAKPGTKWNATLLDIGFIDKVTGAEINETGLPISNEIRL